MTSILHKLALTSGWSKENILAELINMIFLNTEYNGYYTGNGMFISKYKGYSDNDRLTYYPPVDYIPDYGTSYKIKISWQFKNEPAFKIDPSDLCNPFHKQKNIELLQLKDDIIVKGSILIYTKIHKKYTDSTSYIWDDYSGSTYVNDPKIDGLIGALWLAKYRYANLSYEYWNSTVTIDRHDNTRIYLNFVY